MFFKLPLLFIFPSPTSKMAEKRKKRQFKKHMYRGYEVSSLIDLTRQELMALFTARIRRRLNRGLKRHTVISWQK
jgi:hypothetical protein